MSHMDIFSVLLQTPSSREWLCSEFQSTFLHAALVTVWEQLTGSTEQNTKILRKMKAID